MASERRSRTAATRRRPAPGAAPAPDTAPERPSEDPEALRQLAEETVRRAAEALRAVDLPVGAEPALVFRP